MPQKIVFFHLLNNFTGSPQILSSVINTAKQDGFEVKLYTSNTEGFLSDLETETNFYRRSEHRILTLFSFFFSQFLLSIKLLVKNKRADGIYYINTILPFGAILMGRLLGKRVITHVHEYEISPKLLSNFLFWVVRTFSSEVIVVSRFLQTNPKLRGAKVQVIYNCVTKEFETKAKNTTKNPKAFEVLMLASLRPYKGISEFVTLSKQMPAVNFKLVLSDDKREVDRFIANESLPVNIQIFPVNKDVHSFYANASLILNLAHPDKWVETFGMTILEGMHYDLPAIVPRVGGITELVKDGVNGYQINYNELSEIVSEINKMVAEPTYWKKLSEGAAIERRGFSRTIFESKISKLFRP
ncbi:glycosyltransferase family 4 protein [uncultured Algoriphagus sp.]|uniref:glycosyltransferase family 4 protein n=1 Tax=uncultured Algoriphagus sp. TaxID=417365 RepID=UPI0030ED60E8